MSEPTKSQGFAELGMPDFVLQSLSELGYESPSPIQAASIPVVLAGKDLIGQAQTGTGKTAAFALPLLANLDMSAPETQILVMTPTRELAVQVAEAFQRYARHLKGFRIAPIYGGQDFRPQLQLLKKGVHVVVGTPGRVLDHLRRGTLNIKGIKTLVLDEADEMLRMGFIDDVETILSHCSGEQQTALFSATMPEPIRRIANKYLKNPEHLVIKSATATVDKIEQSYWLVDGRQKLEALRRYFETRSFDAVIVFVRTRESASEVAEKVNAWGYRAEAIHGAINQNQREKTIIGLKKNKFDILVATDVAARGLDVDRFSHVVNFDIPYDSESYVHRIGRTGRAGRSGETVLFVTHRENRLLKTIERDTRQTIPRASMPNNNVVKEQRVERFKQRIAKAQQNPASDLSQQLVEEICKEQEIDAQLLAATLIDLLQEDLPLEPPAMAPVNERPSRERSSGERSSGERSGRDRSSRGETAIDPEPSRLRDYPEVDMERFRLEVGKTQGAKPGDIVGAIANEAGIESEYIGEIHMRGDYSTVDLPAGMPKELFNQLKSVRIRKYPLKLTRYGKEQPEKSNDEKSAPRKPSKPNKKGGSEPPKARRQKPKPGRKLDKK